MGKYWCESLCPALVLFWGGTMAMDDGRLRCTCPSLKITRKSDYNCECVGKSQGEHATRETFATAQAINLSEHARPARWTCTLTVHDLRSNRHWSR